MMGMCEKSIEFCYNGRNVLEYILYLFRSLFPSPPLHKSFYCPTTPRQTQETTPTKPPKTTPTHKATQPKAHWDLVTPASMVTTETSLSISDSSQFNESWPSHTDVSTVGGVANTQGGVANTQGGVVSEEGSGQLTGTLAKYALSSLYTVHV